MTLKVREMSIGEIDMIIDYFHAATPEYLEMLGVDPSRLFTRAAWRERYERDYALPRPERATMAVVWLEDERPVGFSTADKITYGERANMHLHVLDPRRRNQGLGAEAVRRCVDLYFDALKLKLLFCEPNAFNTPPHRTLQKAGFKYLKTHMTVPGPLNFHQAVTRWVIER